MKFSKEFFPALAAIDLNARAMRVFFAVAQASYGLVPARKVSTLRRSDLTFLFVHEGEAMSEDSLRRGVADLVEADVLRKDHKGYFYINPHISEWKGVCQKTQRVVRGLAVTSLLSGQFQSPQSRRMERPESDRFETNSESMEAPVVSVQPPSVERPDQAQSLRRDANQQICGSSPANLPVENPSHSDPDQQICGSKPADLRVQTSKSAGFGRRKEEREKDDAKSSPGGREFEASQKRHRTSLAIGDEEAWRRRVIRAGIGALTHYCTEEGARDACVALAGVIDRSGKPIQPSLYADAVAGVIHAIERGDRNGKPVTSFTGALISAYRDLESGSGSPRFLPPERGGLFREWVDSYRRGVLVLGQIDPRVPEASAGEEYRAREAAAAKLRAEALAKHDAVVAGEIEAEWRRVLEELVGLSDEEVLEWVRLGEAGVAAMEGVRQWLRQGRPPSAGSLSAIVRPHLSGLTAQKLADARELAALRQRLFDACREIAVSAAEVAVGPAGNLSNFIATKASTQAVVERLFDGSGHRSRRSRALVTSLAEGIASGNASTLRILSKDQLEGFLQAFESGSRSLARTTP